MRQAVLGTHIRQAVQLQGHWAGGATAGIYAEPAGTLSTLGKARVWLGTATIMHDADYSFFPERMRVHIPIRGNGVRLHFQAPEEVITLPRFAQYRFDGARPVHAELIDGPVTAFNLIAETNVKAIVEIVRLEEDTVSFQYPILPPVGTGTLSLLYVITGALMIDTSVTLAVDDAFVFRPEISTPLTVSLQRLEPVVELISVQIWL